MAVSAGKPVSHSASVNTVRRRISRMLDLPLSELLPLKELLADIVPSVVEGRLSSPLDGVESIGNELTISSIEMADAQARQQHARLVV